ncbi:MAG TPA: hypothetical protein VEJ39_06680 [Candidatus Acidoferrales bacterium]|nr:hypothetical protein [Candidatus Acidoferrales bacterium]
MKVACRIAVATFILAVAAPFAGAQMMFHTPDMRGVWDPVVGSGGSYEITQTGNADKREMEIFVVGKESVEGKDGYWLEFVMPRAKGGGDLAFKSLTVLDGTNAAVYRAVIQMPGMAQPMEMTKQMLASQQSKATDIRTTGQDVGKETITTPAGTFECEHWRSDDGTDAWISPKAPPYGLIKSVSKDGHTIVLTRVITDAKDHITGTPVQFDPMQMMQQGKPPQH